MNNKTFYLNSSFEAKSLSKGSNSLKIAGYANTTAKDRGGDVVTAEAWAKGVENFRKNPVMLYQHKHDCPIGKFDKITVDKKGIYVEGTISEAAEKNLNVQTLVRDGVLKSFSVGFQVKDGKYNSKTDTMVITDLELLEISIVSVPMNQDSLFSIRKSFESETDYSSFIETFEDIENKSIEGIRAGITDVVSGHYHTIEIDKNGNGVTTYASHLQNHSHNIYNGVVREVDGHIHTITTISIPSESDDDDEEEMESSRPLSPSEQQVVNTNKEVTILEETIIEAAPVEKNATTEPVEEKAIIEETVIEEKTVETAVSSEVEEIEIKTIESSIITEDKEEEAEEVPTDPNSSIPFINMLSIDLTSIKTGNFVKYENKTYTVSEIPSEQSPIFKFLEVDADGKPCDNTFNVNINELSQKLITNENMTSIDNTQQELHEVSTKENDQMAVQATETIDLTNMAEVKKEANTVSAPRVAELVEKTGEAILKEADAKEKYGIAPRESEEAAELIAQISKMKDEIKSLQNTKMVYAENSRTTSQFSEKEMANAVLLSQLLNKRDYFDTKYGSRMKAVTSVDQFLANFSNNIYTEMEQQLVIAPMFQRLAVDAKTFRVPVADEDTDGDVAMFKSGTYATGVADSTNVPVSNQNTISAVEFTPHKFMATTHLAKDEEEDTVLPLIDFLRTAAIRRLARAIDKSILRGTGLLTGFTASPTNAITVGTGYASVITGVTKLATTASLTTTTGSSSTKADPTNIAAARTAMGKYGLQLGNDLVYVTSIEGYNNLVTTSDFRTVDKFGPNATYLTGSVGAVYGIPIVISEFLDNVGVTGNTLGALIYKPGFLIAERRGIEIESEYEPRQQVTAMYLSTRFDFKALTTNSLAALDTTRYAYAVNVNAG